MVVGRTPIAAALLLSACAGTSHTAADHATVLVALAGPLQQAETACLTTVPAAVGSYAARAQCINAAYDRIARAVYPFPVLLDRAEQTRLNIARSVDEGRRTPEQAAEAQAGYDRVIATAESQQLATDQFHDEAVAAEQREASARAAAAALLIFGVAAATTAASYQPVQLAPPPRAVTTHCTSYGVMTDCTTQ